MAKPSILITRRMPSAVLARLEDVCDIDLYGGDSAIPHSELCARVAGKQALICLLTDPVDRAVIEGGAALRIIANVAVGYNNIDLMCAADHGIAVTNTPDVLTDSVADFTWAMVLAITRRLAEGERLLRTGMWKGWALDFMLGTELRGKQLGILGMGRIGRAVAARAPAFGMRVVFAARGDRGLSPDDGALPVSLDLLLASSDVISLHVPLTLETRHLIDQRVFLRMKRSAYLINTSRGPIVDEAALAWALGEHLIAGAALDVYEHEPAVHPDLLGRENALLVPHLGSATREARTAMADVAASNVIAVLAGKPPLTPVAGSPAMSNGTEC